MSGVLTLVPHPGPRLGDSDFQERKPAVPGVPPWKREVPRHRYLQRGTESKAGAVTAAKARWQNRYIIGEAVFHKGNSLQQWRWGVGGGTGSVSRTNCPGLGAAVCASTKPVHPDVQALAAAPSSYLHACFFPRQCLGQNLGTSRLRMS